jgi:hypothetical protein
MSIVHNIFFHSQKLKDMIHIFERKWEVPPMHLLAEIDCQGGPMGDLRG